MSQYNKILGEFIKIGLSENTSLDQYGVNKAMDRICMQNGGPLQFDRDVAQQLWQHTQKNGPNTVLLKDYIQSIMEAQNVLKDHISNIERQLASERNPQHKQELQNDLVSYAEDHKLLTIPFKMQGLNDTPTIIESRAEVSKSYRFGNNSTLIFATQPSQRDESTSLKITFFICLLMAFLEIFVMFHKHHFFNILVLAGVLGIFFLNYFDKTYIKFCMVSLAVSILLDLVWMVVYAKEYWNPYAETQHSTIQTGYLTLVTLIVIIMIFLKGLLIVLLFRYRENSQEIKKVVNFCKLKFNLDGRLTVNPVSRLIEGRVVEN